MEELSEPFESVEPTEVVERESLEVPCENKLGFTALCASCPLVSLFGECPKGVLNKRESPALDGFELIEIDPVVDYGFGFEVETTTQPECTIEEKVSIEVASEAPKQNVEPVEVKKDPQPKRKTEQKQKVYKEKTIEKQSTPSYLDLLFDDTVPVVVATAFRPPVKETVQPPPPPQPMLRVQPPVIEKQAPVSQKKPEAQHSVVEVKPIEEEPAVEVDVPHLVYVVEPEDIPLIEPIIEPVIVKKPVTSIKQEPAVLSPEPSIKIKEAIPVKSLVEKERKKEPHTIATQLIEEPTLIAIAEPEEVLSEPDSIQAVTDALPVSDEDEPVPQEALPDDELVIVVEQPQVEEQYQQLTYHEAQVDHVPTVTANGAPYDTPEVLTQSTVVNAAALLRNIRVLLGSFVLKITL